MSFQFPVESPIIVLALCFFIMLVIPPLCRRLGMPPIFGLILSGIIIGPKGFHVVGENSGLEMLSVIGLLYLMFLITLEIDMFSFRKNKFKSVWFGFFTFIIPFIIGYVVSYYVFAYGNTASLLLACMFSTHTLVSYPIAGRLNITKTEPVVVSIGGTIITDMAVLLLLTIIVASSSGNLNAVFWVKTLISMTAFTAFMLWMFPRISRWYFSHFQSDDTAQYIFVLFSLFLSGLLAELAGIEPIVGAFLCGLVLNRVIPHQSSLMNRTIFIGNTFFVPFFLIHIGMLVDVGVFFRGGSTLILAVTLFLAAVFSKYIAAYATSLIYRYTRAERLLLFGLSSSRAAATIAVVVVGYNIGILGEDILNAAVLIILFTCLVSTYSTDHAGRQVALQHKEQESQEQKADRILVPLSNPASAYRLFDFAVAIHQQHEESVIYPLTVSTSPPQMEQSVLKDKTISGYFTNQATAAGVPFFPAMRVDSNISEGIVRAALELQATHIVMGWSGQSDTAKYFFGTIVDNLLSACQQTIIVANFIAPVIKFRKIYVLVPKNADHEVGFHAWLTLLLMLRKNSAGRLLFISDKNTLASISEIKEMNDFTGENFRKVDRLPDMKALAGELSGEDLFVVVSARSNTVSYSRRITLLPRVVTRYFRHTNNIILYPEQSDISPDDFGVAFGGV